MFLRGSRAPLEILNHIHTYVHMGMHESSQSPIILNFLETKKYSESDIGSLAVAKWSFDIVTLIGDEMAYKILTLLHKEFILKATLLPTQVFTGFDKKKVFTYIRTSIKCILPMSGLGIAIDRLSFRDR